ncbi:MAG: hypothetical protein Q9184_005090 [Pyrenodesmia sp. 2 TL-2023]
MLSHNPRAADHGATETSLETRQISAVIGGQSFLRRAGQASAVAGNFLYIDGGEIAYQSGDATVYQYSSTTLSIDLSQDWVNENVVWHTISRPAGVPRLSYPSFWYNEAQDVFYSGITGTVSRFGDSPEPPPLSLWSFKPDGATGSWKEEIAAGDPVWNNVTRSAFGYLAAGGDTGLMLGGIATDGMRSREISGDILLPGLTEFNMTTLEFKNSSTKGLFTADGTGERGQMHFVPSFGSQGLFFTMGGGNAGGLFGFDNIWVYEAGSQRWFNQTAAGNLPQPRSEFCIAGINSTEETYEIFLYGGDPRGLRPNTVPYDEIFILSLPAFHWFKVDYLPQHPRGGHSCNAVGGSQVISVGGWDANPKIYRGTNGNHDELEQSRMNSTVDPFSQGLGIFDMTTLAWADHYTANPPPYTQSKLVRDFYRDRRVTHQSLREIFQTTHFTATPLDLGGSSDSGPTGTFTPKPASSSNAQNSIIGGVVGGVAGLAVAVAAVYFYRRRQRKQALNGNLVSDEHLAPDTEGVVYPLAEPPLQEADADAEYKGAQLETHEIHEMQHHPAELAESQHRQTRKSAGHCVRYEMEATQRTR